MATIEEKTSITFEDILLKPSFSDIKSRSEVDVSVTLKNNHGTTWKFENPIVPANMKDIVGYDMAKAAYKNKGLVFLHRFSSLEEQVDILDNLNTNEAPMGENVFKHVGVSLGVKEDDKTNAKIFYDMGVRLFCLDIAHAHSAHAKDMCQFIKSNLPDSLLIAGNVATADGAEYLFNAGADVVKVGVGSSGICTTRLEAGAGVPQISALQEVEKLVTTKKYTQGFNHIAFISDGGAKITADVTKALAFADMIMSGSFFSGCNETPSTSVTIDGVEYKTYGGSSTHKETRIEGVKALVKPKGSYKDILTKIIYGLQSGCSYTGAKNLFELKFKANFVKISSASIRESKVHSVEMLHVQ